MIARYDAGSFRRGRRKMAAGQPLRWVGLGASMALGLVGPAAADNPGEAAAAPDAVDYAANSEAMFDYLTAELAAQRGDLDSALAIYHRLARELKDPAVAR